MLSRQRRLIAVGLVSFLATQNISLVFAAPNQRTAQATAQGTVEVRKAIQASYNRLNAALAKKDLKTIWSLRTKDFAYISKDGRRLSGSQLRTVQGNFIKSAKSLKGASTIRKITVRGNTATVVVDVSGTMLLVHPQTKQQATLRTKDQSSDTWVKTNGRWLMAQSKVLSHSATVNGKAMRM